MATHKARQKATKQALDNVVHFKQMPLSTALKWPPGQSLQSMQILLKAIKQFSDPYVICQY